MDKVRLGKVLGAGVRHAARTAIEASKAAAAADPNPAPRQTTRQRIDVRRAAEGASRGFFGSVKHAGRAVWLQVMGTLFAFFALYFVQATITHFPSYREGGVHRQQWYMSAAIALLFTWFAVSSFVRAARKPR
jgi:hypothetical protein